jgi:hypothetical protein
MQRDGLLAELAGRAILSMPVVSNRGHAFRIKAEPPLRKSWISRKVASAVDAPDDVSNQRQSQITMQYLYKCIDKADGSVLLF